MPLKQQVLFSVTYIRYQCQLSKQLFGRRRRTAFFTSSPSIDAFGCLQPANSQMSASAGGPNKHQLHFNKTSKAKSSYLDQFRAGLNLQTLHSAHRMLVTDVGS